jgi:hypothetical protein
MASLSSIAEVAGESLRDNERAAIKDAKMEGVR